MRSIEADLRSKRWNSLRHPAKTWTCSSLAFTSILENGSIFYAIAAVLSEIVTEAFPNQHGAHSFQEDILSRKNQIVPLPSRAIINSAG